jgi:hypothetical protein
MNDIVAVSGGRYYRDMETAWSVLDTVHRERGIRLLVQGACPVEDGGADELARRWAISRQVNCVSIPPKIKQYGWPSAGPKRNEEMARLKPSLWILFPGNRGTASARQIATREGIQILEAPIVRRRAAGGKTP